MLRAICLTALLVASGASFAQSATKASTKLKVALTFDDLPVNGPAPASSSASKIARETLAVLAQHRIPPSYGFINAGQLEQNPDGALALRLWIAAGNPLANHSYSHMDLTTNTADDFGRDVLRNEPALMLLAARAEGISDNWRWFRYPYLHEGNTLEKRYQVRGFLQQNGYRVAQTTLDYEDYMWNNAHARCVDRNDAAALAWLRESYLAVADEYLRAGVEASRTAFGRDIHHVLLLHLGSYSSTILPDLFALLKKQNFEIVTLEEAYADPAYQSDPGLIDERGGTLSEQLIEARKLPYPKVTPKPRERLRTICS